MVEPVLHFGRDEYGTRLAKTRRAMEAAGIEVLVVTDASNMAWLTGYDGWSFYTPQAVVVAGDGEPLWWGRGMDVAGALRTCWMAEGNLLGFADTFVHSSERHAMEDLAVRIAERGWGRARIGAEMDNWWLSAASFAALQRGLPEARFQDATGLVNWQRAVKSEAELGHMRTAARIVERMHARILEVAEPGLRKCDLAAEIWDAALRYDETVGAGGDYPAIVPMMPSGADAAAPHLTWDDRPLVAGEGTFFELAGVSHRYHCPLARTLFLGKPTRAFLDAEATVQEGMEAGLAAAVPGNRVEDIAKGFLAVLERRMGIRKESRSGYSIGLSYPPDWGERTMSIRPGDRTLLEPGMTFHFMTGLWMADWGFEITESIVIGESGPECLAEVPRRLFVKD